MPGKKISTGSESQKMSDFRNLLKENLENDPEFKEIWENNAQKRELVKTIIALRIKEHLTQEDLAEKMGTQQSAISRLEIPVSIFFFELRKL
jgi:DNA-directed RNA polymerase specialized sigma subunit